MPVEVRGMTGGRGADFVFDTVGSPATLTTAMACARKGGTVVLTGLSRVDSQAICRDVSIRDAGKAADRIGVRIGQPGDATFPAWCRSIRKGG